MECDYQEAMSKMAYDSMYKLSNGEIVHVVDTSFNSCKARKPNWTEGEIRILIQEYNFRKGILRSKLSNSVTMADKQTGWAAIAACVNEEAGKDCFRTVREVQKKWENLNSKMKLELEQYRDDKEFHRLSESTKAMLEARQRESNSSAILNIPDCGSIKMEPLDYDSEDLKQDSSEDSPSTGQPIIPSEPKPNECVPVKLVQVPKRMKSVEEKPKEQVPLQSPSIPELTQYQPILPKPAKTFDNVFALCANPQQTVTNKLQNVILSRVSSVGDTAAAAPRAPEVEMNTRLTNNGVSQKRPHSSNDVTPTPQQSKATIRLKRQILVLKKRRLKSDIERIEMEKERIQLEKEKLQMEKETVALAKEKITLELANVRNILPLSYKS